MTGAYCPICRQPQDLMRAGKPLPAIKAAILHCIKRAGPMGVSADDILYSDVYDRRKRPQGRGAIRIHIWQLNTHYLCKVDLRIATVGHRYVLVSTLDDE